MYYLTLVRIIVNGIDKDAHLTNLRRHLARSGVKHGYYLVKEISKVNKLLHMHACISVETIEDKVKFMKYIECTKYNTYVDKIREIPNSNEASYYIKYMQKDITETSREYIDYMSKDYKDTIWEHLKVPFFKYNKQEVDDPFIDSEEEIINSI